MFSFTSPKYFLCSKESVLQNEAISSKKVFYIYYEYEMGGCLYSVELFINDDKSGGEGYISQNCGNGVKTYGFKIKRLVYTLASVSMPPVAVESIDDIEWVDALPADMDNDEFYSMFLEQLNENLSTIE